MKYPKSLIYALKFGTFLTVYSAAIVFLSVILKDVTLGITGLVLFLTGFSFVAIKLLIEERHLKKRLKLKKSKR